MDKINISNIDKKWQSFWSERKNKFKNTDKNKKVLLSRNVSIPIWKNSYGSC